MGQGVDQLESKYRCKDQESKLSSTTPDTGYQVGFSFGQCLRTDTGF